MNFDQSIEYLLNLGNEVLAMKLGLENIQKLLSALGNPENNYLKVQIAGTNGKGSACAFLEAICVSAKIKVGMTTSPHLISITERIKINGKEISEADFARYATRIRETSEQLVENYQAASAEKSQIPNPKSQILLETVPTFFEQVTAIALLAFSEANIELAILETGLGGRFDATTAANAEIVAITPIDYDHERILGETLTLIASEKAAIIRRNTKVVVANQSPEALGVILSKCAEFAISPNLAANVRTENSISNSKLQISNFQTSKAEYKNVRLNLLGKHQIENAKVAVLLAEILQDYFSLTNENIIEGLQTATHPGRLEFYKNYLFDGAHNVAGARALREYLDEFIRHSMTLIFGAMRDKDLTEITEILFPVAEKIIFTRPDNLRSLSGADLFKLFGENIERENVWVTENVENAINLAKDIAGHNNLILVTGSLYLVGEAKKILSGNG